MLDNACVGDTLTRGIRAGPGVLAQGGGRLPGRGMLHMTRIAILLLWPCGYQVFPLS